MPHRTLVSFFLLLSVTFNGCFCRPACKLSRITAQEPTIRVDAEAGSAEFWDRNSPETECTEVLLERLTVDPKGLILPHHANAHGIYFVLQGEAVHGVVDPGCADAYESPEKGSVDRHQKVVRVTQGDLVVIVIGTTHWIYNDGDVPLVIIGITDLGNKANQIDHQYELFWHAGNSQNPDKQSQEEVEGLQDWENVWNGFDDELLSEILRVPQEIVRKLKGQQNNRRGGIVLAENLKLSLPEFDLQQQQGSGSGHNGLEETICTPKLKESIANPARADIYNPRAGRVSIVNSKTLPILQFLGLSAVYADLYSHALWAPSWTSNANTLLYVIRGSTRVQIVGATGNAAFDGEVKQGQLIVVPQNYVVLKKAGDQGLEFIAFKTNHNAVTSSLAGRLSALWGLPENIISASFRMPVGEARRVKYGRKEALILSGSESQGRRADALKCPASVLLQRINKPMSFCAATV